MIAEVLVSLGLLAGGAGEVDEDVSAESYQVHGKTSTTVVNEVLFTENFNYSKERKDDDSQENSDKEERHSEPEQVEPEEVEEEELEPEPAEDVEKEVQEADDDVHSNTGGDGDDGTRTDLDDASVHDSDLDVDGRNGQEREEVESEHHEPEKVEDIDPEPAETPDVEESSAEDVTEPEIEEESAGSFEVTAYVAFCDTGCTGMTATGLDVSESIHHEGKRIVATDPDVIPTGSTVYMTLGNGEVIEAVAQDAGGDIQGNRVDLLVGSEGEARDFGRQTVEISVRN